MTPQFRRGNTRNACRVQIGSRPVYNRSRGAGIRGSLVTVSSLPSKGWGFASFALKAAITFCLRHEDGRSTVVPVHSGETIGPGLLHRILRDCQLTADDLSKLL